MNAQNTEDHPSTKGQFFCRSEDDEATTSSTATMPHSNVSARGAFHRILREYFPGDTARRSLETHPAILVTLVRSLGSNIDSVARATDEDSISYARDYVEHSNVSARGAIHRISRDYFAGDTVLLRSLETNPAGLAGALRSFGSNIDSVAAAMDEEIISYARDYVKHYSRISVRGEVHRILRDYFPVDTVLLRSLETNPAGLAGAVRSFGSKNCLVFVARDEEIISDAQDYVEQRQPPQAQHSNDSVRGAFHRILRDYFPVDTVLLRSLETNPDGLAGALRSFGSNIDSVAEATDEEIISYVRDYVEQRQPPQAQHSNVSVRDEIHRILRDYFPVDTVLLRSLETNPAELAGALRSFGSKNCMVAAARDEEIISDAQDYVEQLQHQRPSGSIAVPQEHTDEGSSMTTDGSGGMDILAAPVSTSDRMSDSHPPGPNDMSTDCTMDRLRRKWRDKRKKLKQVT